VRLTYNFGRKGGYSWKFWDGEEDYRWEILRKKPYFSNPFIWFLFNFGFISFYQSYLILGFTLPMILTIQATPSELNYVDYLAATLFLGFLTLETIADQQ